jgi:hypothetical protein
MAHFLPSLPSEALAKEGQVQDFVSITRVAQKALTERSEHQGVAVQVGTEPEIGQGAVV